MNTLQESPMVKMPSEKCFLYNSTPELKNLTICISGINHGPQHGDSGGPLMALRNGRWYLVGSVSVGSLERVPDERLSLVSTSNF